MADDGRDVTVYAWQHLLVEAGASPWVRRLHSVLWFLLLLLIIPAAVVSVIGVFVGGTLLAVGLAVFVSAVVLMFATSFHRWHLIRKVRWAEGSVTFRTVEPQGLSEEGQYVVCQVTIRPPVDFTQVGTHSGPLDAQHLVVGATMRCLIDRNEGFKPLHVFPYARPDAPLPSGRVLKFQKA